MTNHYDLIIIGAGHNGLTAAAYLAKAGKKVLLLEKRPVLGGAWVGDDDTPNFAPFAGGMLRPDITRHLGLQRYAPLPDPAKTAFISLLPNAETLTLDPNPAKAAETIRRFSAHDAARWPDFLTFMDKAAAFLDAAYRTVIPPLPHPRLSEGLPLAQLALKLRGTGRKEMLNIIRALPMTALELTEEWFESDVVRAAVASLGIHGVTLGVMSAGTAFNLIHNWLNRGGLAQPNVGRGPQSVNALAQAARALGVEIRTQAEVARIRVERQVVQGVTLASGEEINAPVVVSALDPRRTFLGLVGAMELPPTFVWQAQNIKMRGAVAKIRLTLSTPAASLIRLSDSPSAPESATYVVAPAIRYLEQAYDAAKYGQISAKPYLEITTPSENVLDVHFQFAPYALKDSAWDAAARARLETLTRDTLAAFIPNLHAALVSIQSLTPLDLEQTYSLTEGDLNHGQIMLDQFFFMRPIPGYADHTTPIDGLYLAGSGVHAGGGISGASGRNAAQFILKKSKIRVK